MPSPASFLDVTLAGTAWSVRTDAPQSLFGWLGPWAVPASDVRSELAVIHRKRSPISDHAPCSAVITELPEYSIRSTPGTLIVEYSPGKAVPAVRAALRLLAIRRAFLEGGLALHAAGVLVDGRTWLFAGPSGTGKTTAAGSFPEASRIESDMVLVKPSGDDWVRLDVPDFDAPSRFGPGEVGQVPVEAILCPSKADAFSARLLRGADAVKALVTLPPPFVAHETSISTEDLLALLERLAGSVPVVAFSWSPDEDLPALISSCLPRYAKDTFRNE